jgi:L-seryl-tRNA(Ser) seleniumtransferase
VNDLRSLPSVDHLLNLPEVQHLSAAYGRPLAVDAIRMTLDEVRVEYLTREKGSDLPGTQMILKMVEACIEDLLAPTLRTVINATGVVLHTNLGRAPLSRSALQSIQDVASGYGTLEYDLNRGVRGSRLIHAETLLTRLTGAEAAIVVNNNASAVLLVLAALARRKRVIISRTQLVEIGGGFRIPSVMRQSGAKLVEVGATNRVHLADYEEALAEPAAMLLHAHHSNFRIIGFTSEPTLEDLSALARRKGVLLVDDLGSGALLDTSQYGLSHEMMVQESLGAGVDLVCFSGDKLLGGPQAGIVIGRAELIDKVKKHQLARALRADKLCLAALSATLQHYLKDEAEQQVPIWQMISMSPGDIEARAHQWTKTLGFGKVVPSQSKIGGGSLPEEWLPTYVLRLQVKRANQFLARLRAEKIPVIARIEDKEVVFDPRTVLPEQDKILLNEIKSLFGGNKLK